MLFDLDKPIYVKMFGKYRQNKSYWHNGQCISANLLMYLISGSLNMEISGTVYSATAGDVILIPANTPYRPLECEECSYYFIHFSAATAEEIKPIDMQNVITRFREYVPEDGYAYNYYGQKPYNSVIEIPIHTKQSSGGKINEIFSRAAKLNIWRNNAEKLLLDNITRELLISISLPLSSEQPTNNMLQKILLYINKHYTEPITLSSISEKFDISTSYTTKLFKTYIGTGTVDYINNLRLSAACEYLISSDYTIGEISDKIGYTNQYYFDRLFRRKYGITPKDFRKANYIIRP